MLVIRYRFVGAVPRLCNQEFGPPVQSAQRRQPWAQHVLALNIGIDVFVSCQHAAPGVGRKRSARIG